jgi:hypothetical protein
MHVTELSLLASQALMGYGSVLEDVGSHEYGRKQITWPSFKAYVARHWLILFAPAMAWLLLDVGEVHQPYVVSSEQLRWTLLVGSTSPDTFMVRIVWVTLSHSFAH